VIVPIIVFNVIGDAHELGFGLSSNTLIKLFAVLIIFLVEGLNSNDEFFISLLTSTSVASFDFNCGIILFTSAILFASAAFIFSSAFLASAILFASAAFLFSSAFLASAILFFSSAISAFVAILFSNIKFDIS